MTTLKTAALLAAQTRLRNLIEGFRFNLGFSGKYYQKGTLEENLGDQRLLENKNKFWWFPHMWRHEQPHKFLQPALERAMLQNFLFAKKHNITVDQHYAVAPHHSGVFPVHKPLYDSWQNVWNISVTSTEEYPHLHPARRRRGFKHKGIKVLPRQTCGLYTHNLFIDQYPGGRHRLEGSIQGGELFQTFLFNLVNIFMTHMCNYGNDRLALYTFESVVKFLHCWTNLKLKARKPLELAKIYFSTYPEEEDPIWLNPCRDKRHLAIWSASKTCKSLPDFIVIGPQKTGTTALYLFIKMHPLIISNNAHPFIFEELHFFSTSRFYRKGLDWYMDSFPVVNKSSKFLLFEKSADYFDSNLAPLRAAALVPNAKLICILQDPIKRAYSWYHHARAHKSPASLNYTFLEVITADERSPRILKDLRNRCLNPGMYAQHLERWLTFFPSSQLLIIDGEEVRENPVLTMDKVQKFLQVHKHIDYSSLLRYDSRKGFFCQVLSEDRTRCLGPGKGRQYPTIDLHSKKHLKQLYRRHNVALSKLLIKLNQIAPLWLQNNLRDMQ